MSVLKFSTTSNASEPLVPNLAMLEASKALAALALADRTYALRVWSDAAHVAGYKHDLALMFAHEDLEHVRLELLAADNTVLAELRIIFAGSALGYQRDIDSGNGFEIPVLDRHRVVGHRIVVQRRGKDAGYRQWLQIAWGPAETLALRPGTAYTSQHQRRITGGRQNGTFHVASEDRHRLRVTQTGKKGFAFATDLNLGLERVFLHRAYAPSGLSFRYGQLLTAVVVQTPAGFQARAILPGDMRRS